MTTRTLGSDFESKMARCPHGFIVFRDVFLAQTASKLTF